MARIIPLLVGDLGAPVLPVIFASDAQGAGEGDNGGYGVVAADAGQELSTKAWETGTAPGKTIIKLNGDFSKLKFGNELEPTIPFSRLPRAIFDLDWRPVAWGRWLAADHITLGEARAVIKLLEVLIRLGAAHRSKAIALQDNGAVAGSFSKGRSPAPALNYYCRRRCALTMAMGLRLALPWTETSRMPADELSRAV